MLSPYLPRVAAEGIGYAAQHVGYAIQHGSKYSSAIPVPESPPYVAAFTLLAALAASVWFLRKKTVNIPVLMK
jgi:hypothetical protein